MNNLTKEQKEELRKHKEHQIIIWESFAHEVCVDIDEENKEDVGIIVSTKSELDLDTAPYCVTCEEELEHLDTGELWELSNQ